MIVLLCTNSVFTYAQKAGITGPHLIVYKTNKNFNNHVPVSLSEDKLKLVSYPDPKTIRLGGKKILPSKLHKGFLLDNRGIGQNVAFLKLTYEEYVKLSAVPTTEELYNMIISKDPLTILCDCGLRSKFKNPVEDINSIIDSNKLFTNCKVLIKK